jgi:hypothetical protein
MPKVDMSAEAVTARLKLVSELRDLCLLLGTAKIEPKAADKKDDATVPDRRDKKSK